MVRRWECSNSVCFEGVLSIMLWRRLLLLVNCCIRVLFNTLLVVALAFGLRPNYEIKLCAICMLQTAVG
ncbi:hypothetical protein JHK82_022989 [Glycine max]|uniref:Uncharacterized protein n=1 Tax=Glycine soja TaxID=3848 RepID=A0A445JLY9_GLYSO|nr:hypothetical protein JHK82_022989 [Glycine max]RZB99535.1 hypothetical protein D0Y65_022104 [Glycine soja]